MRTCCCMFWMLAIRTFNSSTIRCTRCCGKSALRGEGEKEKPEILLLNKIDTEEGEENYPFWRALIEGSIPISAEPVSAWWR